MLDLIASIIVRGLNAFFHVMPMGFNLWLGRRVGTFVCFLSGKRKHVTYANMKAAFSKEKSPREIKRLTKNAYRNMTQVFMEIVSLTKVDGKYLEKYIEVSNEKHLEKTIGNPGGMILLSAHFGNWELAIVAGVDRGYELHILARDQKMKRLNELFNLLRESKGSTVIRKGTDIKQIFRVLRDGKGLGILADQNAGANGMLVPFFGRPASSAAGPYRFAQKTGAIIIPAFIHRKKGPYQNIIVEEPMMIGKDDDLIPFMLKYNRLLEKHIRMDPDHWLWMHKRWKVTPLKKILVLDDGKKGHLNQSLAIVEQIKKYRIEEGHKEEDMEVEIAEIRFKSKMHRTILNLMSPLITSNCQGRLGLLEFALDEECFQDITKKYADVIISCGSAMVGVNKVLKMENFARNLTILDPGFFNRRSFNVIVAPCHDIARSKQDNIVITELAPNLIEPQVPSLESRVPEISIGLLFGGENKYFSFGKELTRSVAESLESIIEKKDGCFYVTTSRRTSPESEKILFDRLSGNKRCRKFIIGRGDTDKNTVKEILKQSKVILVSGESISMVSEAISSGKKVLVFMPDKKTEKGTKYEKFVQDLQSKGYIKIVSPGKDMSDDVIRSLEDESETIVPDDNNKIYEKLYKLF